MKSIFAAALVLRAVAAAAAELPDPDRTPGEANPVLTREVLCAASFRTGPYRNVSPALKREIYASYGKKPVKGKCCEMDHLIAIEDGGSNSRKNLWPQPWNEARIKDQLENRLHKLVCSGAISLEEAQTAIKTDWWGAYQKYLRK